MPDLFAQRIQKELWQQFRTCLSGEVAEEFLQTLLNLMRIMFVLNHEYRRNIEQFTGRYQFLSKDGDITMAALFDKGRMEVREAKIEHPDITVLFRNGRTLINFILSPRQDILGSMLRHDVETRGNMNYLNKFAYMAKQLQLMMPQL